MCPRNFRIRPLDVRMFEDAGMLDLSKSVKVALCGYGCLDDDGKHLVARFVIHASRASERITDDGVERRRGHPGEGGMRLQHVQGGGRGDRSDSGAEAAESAGEPRGAEQGPLQLHSLSVPGSASSPGPVSRENPGIPAVDHQG